MKDLKSESHRMMQETGNSVPLFQESFLIEKQKKERIQSYRSGTFRGARESVFRFWLCKQNGRDGAQA